MNKRRLSLKLLICALVLTALATLLVACNIGGADHFDYRVAFVYNTGNIENAAKPKYIGVMKNSLVSIRPGYSNDIKKDEVEGYFLEGWYLPAEFDENGDPKKDNDGFVLLGRKWDFKTDRVNSDITLYGKLVKKSILRFYDRMHDCEELISTDETFVQTVGIPGATIKMPTGSFAPKKKGTTFLGKFYVSATGDEEFEWPQTFGETDVNVYVDMLEGEFSLVGTMAAFRNAIMSNQNIYLTDDIDFKSNAINAWSLGTYSGEINGAGHSIKNVSRKITAAKNNQSNFGGLFGTLGAKAYIHDVTFENANFNFEANLSGWSSVNITIGLFAWKAEAGARVENVTLTGNVTYRLADGDVTCDKFIGINLMNIEDIKDCDYENVNVTVVGQ